MNIAAQDFDGDLNSIRGNWFLRDRAYPYDTIPVNSMIEALQQKEENTASFPSCWCRHQQQNSIFMISLNQQHFLRFDKSFPGQNIEIHAACQTAAIEIKSISAWDKEIIYHH